MLPFVTRGDEVPKSVSQDWSAEPGVEVPLFDERPWCPQSRVPEFVGVIAATQSRRQAREVGGPIEGVATGSRNDVQRRAVDLALAQPPGIGRDDFLSIRNVENKGCRPTATNRRANADSVDRETPFAVAAAGAAKHDHLRRHLNVLIVAAGRRHRWDLSREGRP